MANYLTRVAAAAARTNLPGPSAVGMPSRLPEILYASVDRPAPEALSDGGPFPLELENQSAPSLALPQSKVPEIGPLQAEPSNTETAGTPYQSPQLDDSLILVTAVKPEPTVSHDPRKIPPLTEPADTPEQARREAGRVTKSDSARPDRPFPAASPPKPVVSPHGSVQVATEIQSKDSRAIGDQSASPGIVSKAIDSAGIAGPVDHPGRSETREAISPPQPIRIQPRQPNSSLVDASVLGKSARKNDAGARKPIAPPPAASAAVELSSSGGNQGRASTQPTEADPLNPIVAPPDRRTQEKPGARQLTRPAVPEATPLGAAHGGQAIAPAPVTDRLGSQKKGTRISIGRIEVQVNNHPQPVAAAKPTAQPASPEINLESRFLGRFGLQPT